MINSTNTDIHGDTRILKILINKEEQAYKNIGDPALLMGLFNVESEELFTAAAIESNIDAAAFEQNIDKANDEFDPFELLMSGSSDSNPQPTVQHDETLFRDLDYLKTAVAFFARSDRHPIHNLQTVEGVEIEITPDLQRRLDVVLPDEIKPRENYLQLIWGYFKGMASLEEKERFFNLLQICQGKGSSMNPLKRFLYKLAEKYKQEYLHNSYYFI